MSQSSLSPTLRENLRSILAKEGHPLPTYFLFACGVAIFSHGWAVSEAHPILLFVSAAFGQYLLYTCMHEAVHGTASRWAWLNQVIGISSAFSLFAPFLGFRYVHLQHHRHTNVPEHDPDFWSARSGILFRWLSQDIHYYYVYLRAHNKRPRKEQIFVAAQALVQCAVALGLLVTGQWKLILLGWFLPSRLVVAWLSFVFNYLPHHPHDIERQNSIYTETCVRPQAWLSALLLNQNYHNIHHLYPSLPFYRYGRVWRMAEGELCALGTEKR